MPSNESRLWFYVHLRVFRPKKAAYLRSPIRLAVGWRCTRALDLWRKTVNVYDFIDPKLRRAIPHGIYDINNNIGSVSVGADQDTAGFAVHAIHRWWRTMGKKRLPSRQTPDDHCE